MGTPVEDQRAEACCTAGASGSPDAAACAIPVLSKSKNDSPMQPKLSVFPKRDNKFCFHGHFYEKYSWIEYSVSTDDIFCFCCRHFGKNMVRKGEVEGNRTFIDKGFTKYKNIRELLDQHQKSARHATCKSLWDNHMRVTAAGNEKDQTISATIDKATLAQIAENRTHIIIMLEAVSFLGRQGLAYRGHDESQSSSNQGNFKELVSTIRKINPNVSAGFERRYGSYTGHEIVNEYISLFGDSIRNDVADKVNNAGFFSIMADETKDYGRKEQLSIFVRYFDGTSICERSIGCFHMKDLTAEALAEHIYREIVNLKIDWKRCVAQCYDGASVMAGWANGVQAKLNSKVCAKLAYIHCHAHRLNLVLLDTLKSIPCIADTLNLIRSLFSFINNSNTRRELFMEAQDSLNQRRLELERPGDTRWFYWHTAIKRVLERYEAILVALATVSETQTICNGSAEAHGYKAKMEKFDFILCLFCLQSILVKTHCLSVQLQTEGLDAVSASHLIKVTEEALVELKGEGCYSKLKAEAVRFSEEVGVPHDVAVGNNIQPSWCAGAKRVRVATKKLTDFLVSSSTGERPLCTSENFENTVYVPCVNKILNEFRKRFSDNRLLLDSLVCFIPKNEQFLKLDLIEQFANTYKHILPMGLTNNIEAEIVTVKAVVADLKKCNTVLDLFDTLNRTPASFPCLMTMIKIVLTIPISTASVERFFSTLKLVKTHIRTAMGDERLSNLMLMATEPTFVKNVDLESLVDMFAEKKPRRYRLK